MRAHHVSRVRNAREQRGLTQSALAAAAGISRQSLYAIEAGRSEPSVSIAVLLAKALDRSIEQLFGSDDGGGTSIDATVPGGGTASSGIAPALRGGAMSMHGGRVALAFIRDRWVAHPLPPGRLDTMNHAASGIASVRAGARGRGVRVELMQSVAEARDTVVLMGCAPALGVLAQRLNSRPAPGRFLWLAQSSTAALDAFEQGHTHVAGTHLAERTAAQSNVGAVRRCVPHRDLVLVRLAEWAAGLVVRKGNPLRIASARDLERTKLRIVARQHGSGARALLERQLRRAGLAPKEVLSRALVVDGQFEVARAIALGAADVGLAMEGAALAYELDFIPLAEECFDLVLARDSIDDPRIARLLDVMSGAAFRRELACLGGYRATDCGARTAEIRG